MAMQKYIWCSLPFSAIDVIDLDMRERSITTRNAVYEVFCLSGPGRNDMLLSDSRVGGAYRRRGEPSPKVLPPCVMWLYWQLQCGVDPRQPEDHRQRAAAAQVNTSSLPWFLEALLVWQQTAVPPAAVIVNVSHMKPFQLQVFITQSHSSLSHDLSTLTVLLIHLKRWWKLLYSNHY